jgi:hypothetical protein
MPGAALPEAPPPRGIAAMSISRHWRYAIVMIAALWLPAGPTAAQEQTRVRGTIESLDGSTLTIKTREGPSVQVALAPDWKASALARADLAAITPGTFVGTAAEPQPDGTLKALEVLIFPEAMRGTGEGHRPWDLTPGSTMTNATVEAAVAGVQDRVLTLTYKGGTQRVVVPADAPVVTPVAGDASALVAPGTHVFVFATRQADGSLTASRLTVGKDGLVPPM